jgi:hypothetical protein
MRCPCLVVNKHSLVVGRAARVPTGLIFSFLRVCAESTRPDHTRFSDTRTACPASLIGPTNTHKHSGSQWHRRPYPQRACRALRTFFFLCVCVCVRVTEPAGQKNSLLFFGRVLRETHVRFHTRLRARLLAHNPTLAHTRDTPRSSASLEGENHDPPPPRPCPRAPTCTRAHKRATCSTTECRRSFLFVNITSVQCSSPNLCCQRHAQAASHPLARGPLRVCAA